MKALLFCVFSISMRIACAAPAENLGDRRAGDVEFFSVSPKGHFELSQAAHSKTPVAVSGRLVLPALASADAKVGAIIIQPGSSGVLPHYHSLWAKALNDAGYATFVIDSFSGRGLKGSANDQALLSPAADVADALNALRLLSTHPNIDRNQIGIVGFSRGGQTAMAVAHERFRKAVLGDSDLHFAVVVAHYPVCHYNFFESVPSKTPIRMFLAADDDFVSSPSCESYAALMRAKGYDISVKSYAAFHSYDADHAKVYQPRAEVYARCAPQAVNLDEAELSPVDVRTGARLAEGLSGKAMVVKVFQWQSGCTTRGAYTGHNPNADIRTQVVADTVAAFKDVFR